MHIYDVTVPQLTRTLQNLDRWLERAAPQGDELLQARLAPDQFTLVRQVQTACDNAKLMTARLAGNTAPSHPDTETTFAQLHVRILAVIEYLGSFSRGDFDTAHERRIKLPWFTEGQWMHAHDYLVQFAIPNFNFHVVTAYSILRHKGIQLGKNDFLGQIAIQS